MGIAIAAAAALAIGGAYMAGDAKRKAAGAMKDAIGNVERISVASEDDIARKYDRRRFEGQLALQKELDPKAAALREGGIDTMLANLSNADDETALNLVRRLAEENGTEDPAVVAIKDKILSDAMTDLEAGAKLSPDFQAELVRSGLETGAGAGFGISPGSGAGRQSRELLGAAGIALKQQRTENAQGAAEFATSLSTARANILSGVAASLSNLTNNQFNKGQTAAGVGYSLVPEYGLSGADAVNLDLARINQQQQLTMAAGNVEAQKRTAQGEMYQSMMSSASSALGGAAAGGLFGASAQGAAQGMGYGQNTQLVGANIPQLQGPNRAGAAGWWDRIRGAGGRSMPG